MADQMIRGGRVVDGSGADAREADVRVLAGRIAALEDTEYLFICEGAMVFYDDDGVTGYLGWEEIAKMKAGFEAASAA